MVSLTPPERRAIAALSGVYAVRMLGLFLLLPVLALHAAAMPHATPFLIGIAMGSYGLAQAVFQIPFGRWSDRFGRRPLIHAGLAIFLAGSVLGALATSLAPLIAARALQGAGAMSAAVTALLADATRDDVRTRAMAFIGVTIGLSFVVSLIAAPVLQGAIGVSGIFWLMAVLAGAGMLLLELVPDVVPAAGNDRLPRYGSLLEILTSRALMPYHSGIFVLHFVLTATFLAVPLALVRGLGIPSTTHWKVYLLVFVASLALTIPLILAAERTGRQRSGRWLAGSVVIAAAAQLLMGLESGSAIWLFGGLAVFFGAFNFLEARLPALLSTAAPATERGTALGVFAMSQFLGAFCGGALGGLLLGRFGVQGVFGGCALLAAAWSVLALQSGESAIH